MKKVVMMLMLILGISAANAQDRGRMNANPEERAKVQVERLEKELKLSKEQKESVYNWTLERVKDQQALFQQSGGDRDHIRTRMEEINKKSDEKILSILDEGQKKKYSEIQKQQGERRPGGQGGGRGRGPRN